MWYSLFTLQKNTIIIRSNKFTCNLCHFDVILPDGIHITPVSWELQIYDSWGSISNVFNCQQGKDK